MAWCSGVWQCRTAGPEAACPCIGLCAGHVEGCPIDPHDHRAGSLRLYAGLSRAPAAALDDTRAVEEHQPHCNHHPTLCALTPYHSVMLDRTHSRIPLLVYASGPGLSCPPSWAVYARMPTW